LNYLVLNHLALNYLMTFAPQMDMVGRTILWPARRYALANVKDRWENRSKP